MFCLVHFSKSLLNAKGQQSWANVALSALLVWSACVGSANGATGSTPLEHVTLQLKWLHQFQFAGYYAAQAKGFYRDEGLEVTIREGGNNKPPLSAVLKGEAQFAIGDSDLLVDRIKGQPIVAMAAIFQHSPYVIMSRKDHNIRTPRDLIGKKVMIQADQGEIQLRAMLKRDGIDSKLIDILPQSWRLDDLIDGKVDAMSAYATVEPGQLIDRGVMPATMRSAEFGVDFYGDILFTTGAQIRKKPEQSAAFLRASLKGWNYALKNPDEIAGLILAMDGVVQRGLSRNILLQEAEEMRSFILPEVIDIGHMSPARFEAIAETLASQGLVRSNYSLAGWIFEPSPGISARLIQWMAGVGAAFILIVTLVLLWNRQIQRQVREKTQELQSEVSHRSAVQQQLKISQELVQLLFGTAASGLVMNTPDGRLVMANPAYCTTVGYTAAELQALDMRKLTHPDDRLRYCSLRDRMLAGEFDHFADETRYLKKGGGEVWIRSKVSLVRSDNQVPTHVIAVTEDITESRATEEKLRQSEVLRDAEREKSQEQILSLNADLEERVLQRTAELEAVNKELEAFSYSVSHDLRSPLNTIDGFAQLLGKAEAEHLGDKGRHYLNRIRAGTKEMGVLIDGLLSFAQLSRSELEFRDVDLSAIARQIGQACREREPQRQVRLKIQDGLHASGDRLLLTAVLQNLIGNAWKFTGKRDESEIVFGSQSSPNGERVYFVKDDGAGFDMTFASKLFGTFERLHSSADFSGTGIGLAIVKRVIERHGGRVWAESKVNEGANFFFTLGTSRWI